MPKNATTAALDRLGYLLNNVSGSAEQLKQALLGFEQEGLHKEKLINHPIQRYNGRTSVHLAASNGLFDCLELLLKSGGNPNAVSSPTDLSQTPLHLASSKGYPRCIQTLLDHGANMNIKNTHRETAYNLVKGKVTCEKVFQHAIARYQIPQRTNQQQKRVEALHEIIGVEENLDNFYTVYEQLPPDHKDLATRWTDFYQQTLLYRATSSELHDIVKFMLSCSANQPLHNLDTNETPLLIACRKSQHDIAKLLLDHSPKLLFISDTRNSLSPLHIACSRGDAEMVGLLLGAMERCMKSNESSGSSDETEVSLDFRDELGRTPLFNACYYGYLDIVKQLVDFQKEHSSRVTLNVNAATKGSERSPLHAAVRKGNADIVHILLSDKSIEVNVKGRPSGRTQHKLIDHYQKNSSKVQSIPEYGRKVSREEESIKEEEEEDTDDLTKSSIESSITPELPPLSPPGTRTPDIVQDWPDGGGGGNLSASKASLAPPNPLHIDDCIGFVAPPPSAVNGRGSYNTLPHMRGSTSPTSSNRTCTTTTVSSLTRRKKSSQSESEGEGKETKKKKRSKTDADSVDSGETSLRVYEMPKTGKLVFQMKGADKPVGNEFDTLFLTPLAEACACYHAKLVRMLLLQGARDEDGLACRISHLIQRPDLVKQILAFHTALRESYQPNEDANGDSVDLPFNLELNWSNMNLPVCKGDWLGEDAEFFPPLKELDMDFDDPGYSVVSVSKYGNLIKSGPDMVVGYDSVHTVNLDGNQLTSVPVELFRLQNVVKINLSRNKLAKLPSSSSTPGSPLPFFGVWACPSLAELNLSSNELTHIPACVWELPNIERLVCSKNKLETLLPALGTVSEEDLTFSLTYVDFSGNALSGTLSRFLFELPCLRGVNLSNNKLTNLPETVWGCETLHDLNLSSNQLKSLPWCEPETQYRDSFFHHSYKHVPMQHADKVLVGKVAVRAPKFEREKSLYNRATGATAIQPFASSQEVSSVQTTDTYDYSSLQVLDLSRNKFSHFPEALPCFAPNLSDLDLSFNPLKEIDVQFLPPLLKKLSAKKCEIVRIGNVISKVHQTQVSQNCRHGKSVGLACQHRSHTQLLNLKTLHLSNNGIMFMQLIRQPNVDDYADFGERETEYNHKIAPGLDLLYPALEGLSLNSNNLLGKFNPNIGHQSHLKWIWLNGNHGLQHIPMEFAYLKNSKQLTELRMADLPNLVEPPPEYRDSGKLRQLFTYMRSRLKESSFYRCIKLFFIGNGERGKTTLLRRLRSLAEDRNVERTAGIDIETWTYPDPRKFSWKERRKPVTFLAWDFAGQEVYQTTHQCFYSKRSMYVALFRLTDGEKGIEELEMWLRSVRLRAPGCPVVIVGTHLDKISDPNKVKELEKRARARYSNTGLYPKIVGVVSISCLRSLFSNQMEKLRSLLYSVACHLYIDRDGISLEYKDDRTETDPRALFQQQIPQTFLSMQEKLREKVADLKAEGKSPIMEHNLFVSTFKELFEDEEELLEAVYFLHLQGTLLHFDDFNLRNVYFLDPQWLAKLMADVIHPAAMGTATHINNGVAEISGLFSQRDIDPEMKDRYISLLEKFEVALKINRHQMIIPSLMPEQASYPKPDDVLSDVPQEMLDEVEGFYQPPLRRFWLADFVPAGFWPRLICRVATDHQIGKVLRSITGTPSYLSPSDSVDSNVGGGGGGDTGSGGGGTPTHSNSPALRRRSRQSSPAQQGPGMHWTPWQTGMAFSYRGRTLMVIKQVSNKPCDTVLETWQFKLKLLKSKFRIEIHVYTNEWVTLTNELLSLNSQTESFECIPGLATKLLVMVSRHVISLALNWFPGMLACSSQAEDKPPTYMPCWKCYSEIGTANLLDKGYLEGSFICKNNNPVSVYVLERHIATAALGKQLECSIHGKLKVMHMAPDLVFWDLSSDVSYQDSQAPLHICEDEVLGKGGFGFVCKGEIQVGTTGNLGNKKNVAVKIFLNEKDSPNLMSSKSISELLALSKKPDHLVYAYKEIRQEVSFLSNLNHQNVTKLCGVRTTPYMCLVLELAPKKSLRAILKEYRECMVALEPLTLKNAALQIAQGLEYLHSHQVVHLDMKSPNVLIWHFPSPRDNRQVRIRQAGNVLIKIADYGISEVSTTGLTLRVDNKPVGTPGFMSPELFDRAGQVISSEKVDVFAYGMVLFEMLSQRSPFDDVEALKRNHEVREGKRPALQAKETRTLIQMQDVMRMCWEKEPENRPTMSQIVEWIRAPEFERLRAEIALGGVRTISCACVCRILPEYEADNASEELYSPQGAGAGGLHSLDEDLPSISEVDGGEEGGGMFDSLIRAYGGSNTDLPSGGASIDLIVPNMLPSISMDSVCIETVEGTKISNEGEDIYQFIPNKLRKGSTHRKRRLGSHSRVLRDRTERKEPEEEAASASVSYGDHVGGAKKFEPYTQIWMCGRDQRKGSLQIFTYNDGIPGSYLYSGYCSRDEITCICPVRNMMWMGTSAGAIKVFHAPTLKTKFTCTLETEEAEGKTNRTILDILYVEEMRTVLIANFSGEVWSFYDTIVEDGLRLQCKIELSDGSPCYHMCKVTLNGGTKVEVWGTMENNRLLVMEKPHNAWLHSEVIIDPKDSKLRLLSHVAFTSFVDTSGREAEHIWVSYRQRSALASFNARNREQRCVMNVMDKIKTESTFQITALACTGRKILVGTTTGHVAIIDSQTLDLLSFFHWHKDKVRTILVMPRPVEPCICAEIPFPESENTGQGDRQSHNPHSKRSMHLHVPRLTKSFSKQFSYLENEQYMKNTDPDSFLVTSVGNGKESYCIHTVSREDRVREFDKALTRRSLYRPGSRQQLDDVVLLTWKT